MVYNLTVRLCMVFISHATSTRVRSIVLLFGCNQKLRGLPFDSEKQGVLFDNSDKGIGDQDPGP